MTIARVFARLLIAALCCASLPADACRPFGSYRFVEDEAGGIWFTEGDNNAISRLAPDGAVVSHRLPTRNAEPSSIALDGDGNVWFAEMNGGKVGRLDRQGGIVEYRTHEGQPFDLVADRKGNVWFTVLAQEAGGESCHEEHVGRSGIGRIGADGEMAFYPVEAGSPMSVAVVGDRVWATILIPGENEDAPRGRLVRLDKDNRWQTVAAWQKSCPRNLLADSQGRLYFTDGCRHVAGYRTARGRFVEWRLPGETAIQQWSLAADGTLWFTDRRHLGRIGSDGRVRFVRKEDNGDATMAVLAARNGDVVFSEFYNYDINRRKKSGEYVEHLVAIDQRHDSREVKEGEVCYLQFGARIAAKAEMDAKRAEEVTTGRFTPDGNGTEKLVEQKCLVCHDARRLLLSRRSDWTPSITRMHTYRDVRKVEPLTAEETTRLVRYFNEYYGLR